jgi:hypothetical protein
MNVAKGAMFVSGVALGAAVHFAAQGNFAAALIFGTVCAMDFVWGWWAL